MAMFCWLDISFKNKVHLGPSLLFSLFFSHCGSILREVLHVWLTLTWQARPFLSSFLSVFFSQHTPAVYVEHSIATRETFTHLSSEDLLRSTLSEAPTMVWMMMIPPKFMLKCGPQCHKITFRKWRCHRGFIPSQGLWEATGRGPFLLPCENTAFLLLGGCHSKAPSWKYRTTLTGQLCLW